MYSTIAGAAPSEKKYPDTFLKHSINLRDTLIYANENESTNEKTHDDYAGFIGNFIWRHFSL